MGVESGLLLLYEYGDVFKKRARVDGKGTNWYFNEPAANFYELN